jgi:hypothetical protein
MKPIIYSFVLFYFTLFCFVLFFTISFQNKIFGQERPKRFPSATRNIEDLYRYVHEKIKHNQYYVNEWNYNHFKQDWWDKTQNYGTEAYHYSFLGENEPVLRMATLHILKEKMLYQYEFLFNQEGHLCLVIEKQKDTAKFPYREMRIFFDKRKCVNLFLDKDIIPHNNTGYNEKIGILQELGEDYYQKFQKQVEDIVN